MRVASARCHDSWCRYHALANLRASSQHRDWLPTSLNGCFYRMSWWGVVYSLASHTWAESACETQHLGNPHSSTLLPSEVVHAGLYTAVDFGDIVSTIFGAHDLSRPSVSISLAIGHPRPPASLNLPCVKVPLSDWALKYTSTI